MHRSAEVVLPDYQSDVVSEGKSEKVEMPVLFCASFEKITIESTKQEIYDVHMNDMCRVLRKC
jgi:hypothetical protein